MARTANISATVARKERNGSITVWIQEAVLVGVCEELGLTEEELRKHCRYNYLQTVARERRGQDMLPDTGALWRWWKVGKTYYYAHNRIGLKYRPAVSDEVSWWLGKGTALVLEKTKLDLSGVVEVALEREWERKLKHYIGQEQAEGLAKAAAVLEVLSDELGKIKATTANWQTASDVVNGLNVGYLPKNYRRLQEKVVRVLGGELAHEVVKLPRAGNNNRKPYTADAELMGWVVEMRQRPENWPNVYVARKLRTLCAQTMKAVPSVRWFEERMNNDYVKFLTDRGRGGVLGKAAKGYGVPMKTAIWAGDRWEMDGSRRNYLPWKEKDEAGKKREVYLYVVALRDVHSGDVPGWCYAVSEDRWQYVEALRMAVRECGYLPRELVIDRFPGHNTDEWKALELKLKYRGVVVTYAETGDKKAHVERWFGTLQTVFDNESDYYYGEGIKSRRSYAHREEKFLKASKAKALRDGWDMGLAIEESDKAIEAYRTTSLATYSRKYSGIESSPFDLHQNSDKPRTIACDWMMQLELFGYEKHVTLDTFGILRTEIQKVEYFFVTEDYDVISKHREVTLVYDIDDLTTALIYTRHDDPNMRKLLCEVRVMERLSYEELGPEKARRKRLLEQREADLERHKEAANVNEVALLMGRYSVKKEAEVAESMMLAYPTGGNDDDVLDYEDVRSQY